MNIRTTKPGAGNKFYITKSKGGYSSCIQGSPTDSQCNVLDNCVGYACGRFNEIIGSMKYPSLNCNAEIFIERARNTYGLEISPVPTLGGIMVWQKGATLSGNDGAGHVAVVEKIIDSNTIYTSESGYGSSAFWNSTRRNSNGRWGLGSGYTFRGCIVNPAIGKITAPTTNTSNTDIANKSVDELAREVIAGKYGNGDARKSALGSRYSEVQAKVNEMLAGNSTPSAPTPAPKPQVDILELVKKTIRGDFGNGEARRKALGSNYDEVQRQVNLNLKNGLTRWDNIKLF
ncbi:MAG: CHAP domain-containing protein [Bacilli bacterium]|nr:CHAP domain-containing protein [Bacilli bacterium]